MKALVLEKFGGPLTIQNVPDPRCPADGAIVAVRACGVCRSDHHAWKGHDPDVELPHVMGHEFAGEVIATGPDCHSVKVGDRVTAPFILGCGYCGDCRSGNPTICDDQQLVGFTYWGAFAEQVAVPSADFNLVQLPDSMEYVDAAAMGCRFTTSWRALTDRAGLAPGEWLAVHGSGGVGLSAIMIAAALGARVLAVDISDDALAKAKALGANEVLNIDGMDDPAQAVRDITGGGAHVSIDALGIQATFENSLRSLRKLGRHVQVGMPVGRNAVVPLPLQELVYSRQLSIYGTRGLGALGFSTLIDMISAGRLDPGQLVTRRISLSQTGDVLKEMDHKQPAGVTVIDNLSG